MRKDTNASNKLVCYLVNKLVRQLASYNRCQNYLEHHTSLRLNGMILTQIVLILNEPFK